MQSQRNLEGDLQIIDALVEAGHKWEDRQPERAARAWMLAADLAAEHQMTLTESVLLPRLNED